jgi:ABC-type uncharacterized transport system substrate-binding protein
VKALKSILICLLCLLFCPGDLSPDGGPKILVINSDASVEKYHAAGSEYKKVLPHSVVEVRLEEKRWGISDVEELLYDEKADLIYCIGTKAYLIANEYARETDMVFSSIINWKRLPRRERTYGVSNELHPGMQMILFRHVFPNVKKIGVLYSRQYNIQWFENAMEKAKEMDIELIGKPVYRNKHMKNALKTLLPEIDALWMISDPVIVADNKGLMDVLTLCDEKKIPVFSYHAAFAKYGATLIVSVDNPTIGGQAAEIALELISGEKIHQKVQYPAGSHIILNLNKVKAYGLEYNENALASVNRIIE